MAARISRFRRLVLALMAALAPVVARAQQPVPQAVPKDLASLGGVVGDSIRGGPLVGALVSVVGTTRQAKTDPRGGFRIDSIEPGVHTIVVSHPFLDTLGLQVRTAPFTLEAGMRLEVDARTPSFADIRERTCPKGGVAYGPSIFLGRVKRADSGEPAAGAVVSLVFKSPVATNGPESVRLGRADATGAFAICGLPSRLAGNVQASLGGTTTADVPVTLNGELVATAILSIGTPGSGSAVLKGTVRSKAGAPVAGAQVAVVGTSAIATTADDGSFVLGGLPSGTREAAVRKIGFASRSQVVALSAREPATVTLVLDEAQVLTPVKIVGKLDGGLTKTGFASRREQRMGWYLTPDEIEKRNPLVTTDMLRQATGLRVANAPNGTFLQATRHQDSTVDGCINIFIDYSRFEQTSAGDVDNAVPAAELGAVEYYAGAPSSPAEFRVAGRSCATLVIWSKTLLASLKP